MAHGGSKLVVIAALAANLLIAVAKFVAAAFTRSSAMIAEGFHSLADTVNQLLLLLGIKLSARPADGKHPFGYAQERYFWAFIVAVSIFTVGAAFSCYEGIQKIIHLGDPAHALQHPMWGVAVLVLGMFLEGTSWVIALRQFLRDKGDRSSLQVLRDTRDPILITVLFEDSAAMFGLATALGGLCLAWATGNMLYDGLASVVVGLVLACVAYFLALETKDLLVGESVPKRDNQRIKEIVLGFDEVNALIVHRTMHLGPEEVLAVMKIEFRDGMETDEIEEAIVRIETALQRDLPKLKRIWVEPGSAIPSPALPKSPGPLDP
jgi:cation diffusion facilitator family transporter